MKKYVYISGLALRDNNRGTAALGYGSFSFLKEKGLLSEGTKVLNIVFRKNIFKKSHIGVHRYKRNIQGVAVELVIVNIFFLEDWLFKKFNIILPFSRIKKFMKKVKFVATINGGDGFSDIYGVGTFMGRLTEAKYALRFQKPLIFLPQTIGPFSDEGCKKIAHSLLKYAEKVYVRDDKYVEVLDSLKVEYEKTRDLSFYMKPEPFAVDIPNNAIGINVSGLAYSNGFRDLSGQFENYPYLIDRLISSFQSKGCKIYLIPHSYNYYQPEENNDDLEACQKAFNQLKSKQNVVLLDEDLEAPQIKYVISRMSFFIGTRMHANFAAIYTKVPLYGLSYSYKFEGAFKANGAYNNNISDIVKISREECDSVVTRIMEYYSNLVSE